MCGLLAYLGSLNGYSKSQFEVALSKMNHRGPDASKLIFEPNKNFSLGHNRLSIIDLDPRSNQPFCVGDEYLVYNGEIYNHLELRNLLLNEVEFQTTSDTETLFWGLKKFGESFLNKINGMFAGVYVNTNLNTYMAFRDFFGIKPLFLLKKEGGLFFSSEIKALTPFTELNLNFEIFETYLAFENFPTGSTFYKNIVELQPGEVQIGSFDENFFYNSCYIQPEREEIQNNSFEAGIKAYENSIKSHLISDVDLAVYLSGGIDSSLIACVAAKYKANIKGYVGYFDVGDKYYDESYYAELIGRKNGIDVTKVKITPRHFIENFDELMWALEQPRMGMGSFSQYIVAKVVKKDRKVILAGHGGDELFAGYPMFKAFFLQEYIFNLHKISFLLKNLKIRELVWIIYVFFMRIFKKFYFFAPMIFNRPNGMNEQFFVSRRYKLVDKLFYYYRTVYLPGLLSVEDRISMANSLETRVPLWSIDLFNYAAALPNEIKMKNGELKAFWKELASKYLPNEILGAPKRGFPTPLRLWFKNELFNFCHERLGRENHLLDLVMSKKKRLQLLERHRKNWLPFSFDEKRAHQIWMLICLESIGRQYKVRSE